MPIHRSAVAAASALWLGAAAAIYVLSLRHDTTPGAASSAPAHWPAAAPIERDPLRFTMLFFVHPQCPCTEASLAELGRVAVQIDGRVALHIFICGAKDGPDALGNVRAAKSIPGAVVHSDDGLRAARTFDARTSGQSLVYHSDGTLLFSGGLTAGRGEQGDAEGQDAVLRAVLGGGSVQPPTPVFGCSLMP